MAVRVKADGSGIFDRIIRLPRTEATVYQSLAKITEETGYLFIYDSKLIDNERKIKLKGGKRTVRQAIYDIIGSDSLQLRSVDKHIIINQPETIATTEREASSHKDSTFFFTLEGILIDQLSREPIPYATVSVQGTSIGSVSIKMEVSDLICPTLSKTGGFTFRIWAMCHKRRTLPSLPDEAVLLH